MLQRDIEDRSKGDVRVEPVSERFSRPDEEFEAVDFRNVGALNDI